VVVLESLTASRRSPFGKKGGIPAAALWEAAWPEEDWQRNAGMQPMMFKLS